MISIKFRLLIILLILFPLYIHSQSNSIPSTEVRAVWLTTNWQLDWPSNNFSPEAQQRELIGILDQLQDANFNTVFFQVRVRGDVFYRSNIEPVSPFLFNNIRSGYDLPYDPLEFIIRECHRRGLQCHAWFVTFPVGSKQQVKEQGYHSIVNKQPDICKLFNGEWYLDPGNPRTRQYIMSLVNEIVSYYNIDGIHFDYIRYPENATKFPDNDTFRTYGKGQRLDDWRRNNINLLMQDIYHSVKQQKPWVQVSASPLGRYRTLNPLKGTWTAYESVYQDAALWMEEGIIDAIYPMMYYNEVDFNRYVNEWEKKSNGRFVVPGLGIYRLEAKEGNWRANDVVQQMDFIRYNNSAGMAFYRTGNILKNTKGIGQIIRYNYFPFPAKLPAMNWLKNTQPAPPLNLKVYREGEYIAVEWDRSNYEDVTYTLYESYYKDIDIQNPQNILMTRIDGNKVYLRSRNEENGVYYTVTATDRYNNESIPCHSGFFILSTALEK